MNHRPVPTNAPVLSSARVPTSAKAFAMEMSSAVRKIAPKAAPEDRAPQASQHGATGQQGGPAARQTVPKSVFDAWAYST